MTTATTRLCENCDQSIPAARLAKVPDARLCIACQASYESTHDTRPHIDEGLAGSREDHKRMRSKQWSEMVQRSRGK
jgi:RNA polymerase-binding transcription factor DksA